MKKVLVVDDEPALLRIAEIFLQRKGFQVFTVASVHSAKALIAEEGGFDLIVLDLMMPDETGFDFLNWKNLQEPALRNLPVIIATGKTLTEEDRSFLNINSLAIINKSVNYGPTLSSEVLKVF